MKVKNEKKLSDALLKKALGFEFEEVVEEYVTDKEDGEKLVLNKKKVTKKNVPPDMSAVKTLMEIYKQQNTTDFKKLTDEELQKEKLKLLKELEKLQKGGKNAPRKSKHKNKV